MITQSSAIRVSMTVSALSRSLRRFAVSAAMPDTWLLVKVSIESRSSAISLLEGCGRRWETLLSEVRREPLWEGLRLWSSTWDDK